MKVEVMFFGVLTELMKNKKCSFYDCEDTESLLKKLYELNADLRNKTFQIAVNNELITQNKALQDGDKIALMPPFAGG